MKPLHEAHVCIMDSGTFVPLAEMFSHVARRTSYYSPFEQEFLCLERCVIGDGCEGFERVDEYMDPEFFNSVDLWVFPDIGFSGLQKYLRSLGKSVWGSGSASELELYRTRFLTAVAKVGLPIIKSVRCSGLTELTEYLKNGENKWVKINRYRDNVETWHHIDFDYSKREIEREARMFGPMAEKIVYVVQDAIDGDDESPVLEVGYDGWCIDGDFPEFSFQGYELKNKLYLGSLLAAKDLPKDVRLVNEAMAPVLKQFGYRNFWATEIRIKDGVPYFIDPTPRMAGQTMEHLLETCTNLPEVIYLGAAGQLVTPEFCANFAAEATLHYSADAEGWKTFKVPEHAQPWVKLYRYCCIDGIYHFPPHKSDELGVVIGNGDTIEEALDSLKDHIDAIKDGPVTADISGFASLIEQIEDAQSEGVHFTDEPLPDATVALD